jgi:hypothetical protein
MDPVMHPKNTISEIHQTATRPATSLFLGNFYLDEEVAQAELRRALAEDSLTWHYTSLCRDFSYFEGLKYFFSCISSITNKPQPPNISSLFDLIVVVLNSFELLKKLMESSFCDIILLFVNGQRDMYDLSSIVLFKYFCFNWNEIINEEIISITKSVLYFHYFM